MSASLVGSEMCIRDSCGMGVSDFRPFGAAERAARPVGRARTAAPLGLDVCLLYTSDAADDM
eukprot:9574091-Alexandrium_andersonii.AAC.1